MGLWTALWDLATAQGVAFGMCNDFELNIEWKAFEAALEAARLQLPVVLDPGALPLTDDVRVSDTTPVLRQAGNGVELAPMTWGFPQPRSKAATVFNFRGENRDFSKSKRCLIPASAFFEFTGARTPKSKWRFAMPGTPVFAIAGLWRQSDSDGGDTFTMLTSPPGPDVAAFHDRQIVTLEPAAWSSWLYLDSRVPAFCGPPDVHLAVTLVRAGGEPPPQALLRLAERTEAAHG